MYTSSNSIPLHAGAPIQVASARQAHQSERELQSVFSSVLRQAGREGYVSVLPVATEAANASQAGASWEQWFSENASTRYSFVSGSDSPSVREGKTADGLRTDFRDILVSAVNEGGYASPKSFLQKLSTNQLKAIQQVQHLAEPIDVASLSDEGALNLLLPPAAQVDEDNDGVTSVGVAQTLRFPDSRTPPVVRDAWESATAELSESERLTYELLLTRQLIPTHDANVSQSASGSSQFYLNRADDWLNYLERFKNQIPIDQFERDKRFWTSFRDHIAWGSYALPT